MFEFDIFSQVKLDQNHKPIFRNGNLKDEK